MNIWSSDCKINHFMSENRKKTSEFHHFNIFFGYKVLLIQYFFLSLLTEYIKINQIGG